MLDGAPAQAAERARTELGERWLGSMSENTRLQLVDIETLLHVLRVLERHLDTQQQHKVWHGAFRAELERSFFGPVAHTAFAIMGRSPASLVKWLPRVWPRLFVDCGTMTLETVDDGRATTLLADLPIDGADRERFATGCASCLTGFFDVCGTTGQVQWRDAPRGIRLELTW